MSDSYPVHDKSRAEPAKTVDQLEFEDKAEAFVYSSGALRAITILQDKLDEVLTRAAQGIAMSQGSPRVTADDIFAALDELGLSGIYPKSIERTKDEG